MSSNISSLAASHAEAFTEALARVLSTEVAKFTFGEILDGLPTRASYGEFHLRKPGNSVYELDHIALCREWRRGSESFGTLLTHSP